MNRVMCSLLVLSLSACGSGSSSLGSAPIPLTPLPSPTPPTSTSISAREPSYVPAAAAEPSTGIRLPIGKCVNMGNHLEAPSEGEWGRAIADDDFKIIKAAGFDSVRIPVKWSSYAQRSAPYAIDAWFMTRVKHVVALAEAQGLGVILNIHHYDELTSDPAGQSERFAALWKQIASEFRRAGPKVWFELINEPMNKLNHTNLLDVLRPALAEVRSTNPTRPVIVGGENYSGVPSLSTLPMPSDPYVVPTFHTYDPFNFTHQGATWANPAPPLNRKFGTVADYQELEENLRKVKDYMARTGRVPFIGEYGAIDHPQVPLSERIAYYEIVSSAYASIGVQSCAWDYTNTFRLREGANWLRRIVEAIKTTTTL